MLKYLLQLREDDRIGAEALGSALRVLDLPTKDMDIEKASYKPKQEEEIKEEIKEKIQKELYDKPWCMLVS